MFQRYRKRIFFVILGDIACFYSALFLSLILRYQISINNLDILKGAFLNSFYHFSFIFLIWILLFLISRLYELPYLISRKEFYFLALKLFLIGGFLAVILFYLFTPKLVPKIVLLLTIVFSLFLLMGWRTFVNWIFKERKKKVVIISDTREREELGYFINNHPSFGIEVLASLKEPDINKIKLIINQNNNLQESYIIIEEKYKRIIEDNLKEYQRKIKIIDFGEFYETLTGKVALSILDEEWFNKNVLQKRNKTYELLKRFFDLIGGIILLIISLPLWPLIGLLIKMSSEGPVLFKSKRVGKDEKEFLIYKFRTMIKNANQMGPSWTLKDDPRITKIGKILRYTHLDEVPQVINIIKGDTSFVGPRPEEKNLVELFKKEIPFYEKRMLIKPGIIGWAQINYPHGASIEDAIEKLKYDFYYLKYRSLAFDFLIALKAWRIPFEIKTH